MEIQQHHFLGFKTQLEDTNLYQKNSLKNSANKNPFERQVSDEKTAQWLRWQRALRLAEPTVGLGPPGGGPWRLLTPTNDGQIGCFFGETPKIIDVFRTELDFKTSINMLILVYFFEMKDGFGNIFGTSRTKL